MVAVRVEDEGFREQLLRQLGGVHHAMRVLAKLPQDARYALTRFYAIGFPRKDAETLAAEMNLTLTEFELLRLRAVRELRMGGRDGD